VIRCLFEKEEKAHDTVNSYYFSSLSEIQMISLMDDFFHDVSNPSKAGKGCCWQALLHCCNKLAEFARGPHSAGIYVGAGDKTAQTTKAYSCMAKVAE